MTRDECVDVLTTLHGALVRLRNEALQLNMDDMSLHRLLNIEWTPTRGEMERYIEALELAALDVG